jgi:hypothetical protein
MGTPKFLNCTISIYNAQIKSTEEPNQGEICIFILKPILLLLGYSKYRPNTEISPPVTIISATSFSLQLSNLTQAFNFNI